MAQTSGNRDEPSMEDILSSIRKIIQSNEENDGGSSDNKSVQQDAAQSASTESASTDVQGSATQGVSSSQESIEKAELAEKKEAKPDLSSQIAKPADASTPTHVNAEIPSDRGELTDAPARKPQAAAQTSTSSASEVAPGQAAGVEHVVAKIEEKLNSPAADKSAVPALVSHDTGAKVAASFAALSQTFEQQTEQNLEQMTSEMLRPMLQDWLDDNLPSLVEKLVREEIERVARGG